LILAAIVARLKNLFLALRGMMNERVSGTAILGLDLSIVVLSANGHMIAEIRIISARAHVTFKIRNQHIALSRQTLSLIALVARLHYLNYWTNHEKIAQLLYLTAKRNARKSSHVDIYAKNLATKANACHVSRQLKSLVDAGGLPTTPCAIRVSTSLHLACGSAEQL
jgi:hypothetical protein